MTLIIVACDIFYSCYPDHHVDKEEYTACRSIIRVIMEPLAFLAHLGVLPLLFLQFLSTYASVCVFGDKYCREVDGPDQLRIDRTRVLFGFLFCAVVTGFTASMMKRASQVYTIEKAIRPLFTDWVIYTTV